MLFKFFTLVTFFTFVSFSQVYAVQPDACSATIEKCQKTLNRLNFQLLNAQEKENADSVLRLEEKLDIEKVQCVQDITEACS